MQRLGHMTAPAGAAGQTVLALLAMLPPDGATRIEVLGGHGPFVPAGRSGSDTDLDLLVVWPGRRETWTRAFWRRTALAGQRLGADGVAYVVAAPAVRSLICAVLSRTGLTQSEHLLHRPTLHAPARLLPLHGQPGGRAAVAGALASGSRLQRRAARAAALPGLAAIVGRLAPSVGVALRRPGARALGAWLFTDGTGPGPLSLRVGPRGLAAGIVAVGWPASGTTPSCIAKLAVDDADGLTREAASLRALGPAVTAAGARSPRVVAERSVGRSAALILEVLPGTPANQLLRGHPERVGPVLHALAAWLTRWHRATAAPATLNRRRLETVLLEPASELSASMHGGSAYERRLAALARKAQGELMPVVATHADLTMMNVLWSHTGLGIVDWETANAEGLPLTDLLYAAVDAVYVAGAPDRASAFADCFAPSGRHRHLAKLLCGRLCAAVGLSQLAAGVALHACFLHHALNELRREPDRSRSFLATLERLAQLDDPVAGLA
jgi:hypothetical protein